MLLLDKCKPRNLKEWIGSPETKSLVKNYFLNWINGTPIVRCLLLSGTPGNGKTSIIHAIVNELNLNLIEINASDERNKNDIRRIKQYAYVKNDRPNVVLLDEVDGLRKPNWKDILEFIDPNPKDKKKKSFPPCPIILICNDISKIDYKIIKKSLPITIEYPPRFLLIDYLKNIICSEGLNTITDSDIDKIINNCTNIRQCIYTLQYISMGTTGKIIPFDADISIKEKMKKLFNGEDVYLTNTDHYHIIEWGIANGIDLGQLSKLSILQSLGRNVSGMQDLIREFGLLIRGNVNDIKEPIPRWKKKFKKDKKMIKKLDNNNKKMTRLCHDNDTINQDEKNEPKIDVRKVGKNVEDYF